MFGSHIPVKVKRKHPNAHDLRHGSTSAAAYDVAYCGEDAIQLFPGQEYTFGTGWAFELPENVGMLVLPRSGTSRKQKLRPMNTPGLLDADYRGELFLAIEHFGRLGYSQPVTINPGDYIAQIMFVPHYKAMFQITDDLSKTERGEGGFGSTEQRIAVKKGLIPES